MRIYLASSWRNEEQPQVLNLLRASGHEVYDFRNPEPGSFGFHWSDIDPAWKNWRPTVYREALSHPIAERGFSCDWKAMKWADAGVLLLPCGRSAHLEAGYFVGAGKPLHILLASEPCEPELMYKMASGVHVLASELLAALRSECDEARASLAMCKMGFTPCKCGTCHECQARAAGDCDALK